MTYRNSWSGCRRSSSPWQDRSQSCGVASNNPSCLFIYPKCSIIYARFNSCILHCRSVQSRLRVACLPTLRNRLLRGVGRPEQRSCKNALLSRHPVSLAAFYPFEGYGASSENLILAPPRAMILGLSPAFQLDILIDRGYRRANDGRTAQPFKSVRIKSKKHFAQSIAQVVSPFELSNNPLYSAMHSEHYVFIKETASCLSYLDNLFCRRPAHEINQSARVYSRSFRSTFSEGARAQLIVVTI
jgi:hypothetical protein